jgi:hypothetical protein
VPLRLLRVVIAGIAQRFEHDTVAAGEALA